MARSLPANPSVSLDYGTQPDSGWGTDGTYTGIENGTIIITSQQDGDSVSGETSGVNVTIESGTSITGKGWYIGNKDKAATVTVNGTLKLANADQIADGSKVIVGDGGTLILGGYATTTPGLIEFSGTANTAAGGGGTIEIAAGTTPSIIGFITNITENDTIIIDGMTANGYTYADGIYTLTNNNSPISGTSSFQLPAANEGTTFTVKTIDGKTYLNADVVVCFLAGSMIRTADGDVAVEDLQVGDQVVTFDSETGVESVRPVVWAGKASATAHVGLPDDQAGYPVRILKDAVAEGVPYKDLLVTSEHCMFFDGKFVPVRMLVNGSSIFYDKSIVAYDYYHIETAEHAVISANGMMTESYLDTGNRRSFRQEGKVASIGGRAKTWASDAGAELCVDRAFVEPLFRKLEARKSSVAEGLRHADVVELTNDADLHLVTETGAVVRPVRHEGQRYSFMLPANVSSVRIVSRASRPADVIGPFVDDRRQMGVAVGDITFVTAARQENIVVHLAETKPEGWHADASQAEAAWTAGNAVLPLSGLTDGNMGLLSLNVVAAGPYVVEAQKEDVQVLSA
ncbi:Hint domain-containing protein [Acetobacter persici]|uniref:Hint domain-containing protein n=1 Tax=Acetobacter persici TaxID=1076596 RepID=UPI001BAB965A|nr:Hint domain-containing protein [Acetobacter persici]MBS1016819.1 Hint domain-containing protein [Acetobacter persici]